MPVNTSKTAYRINVEKPVIAFMTSDDSTGCEYEAPKSIGKAMQVTYAPKIASGTLYGDGGIADETSQLTGADFTLGNTKIPIEIVARMYGHNYINGIMVEKKGDEPIPFAFGYEVPQTNGEREFIWLLKCKAQPMSEDVKQQESNVNYSTDSVKFSVMPREFDNAIRFKADTANEDFTAKDTIMSAVPTTVPAE